MLGGLSLNAGAQTSAEDTASSKKASLGANTDTAATPKKTPMISIGPVIFDYALSRGQSKSQYIYIINRKPKPYAFTVTMEDFSYDSLNNIIAMPAGSTEHSCTDWITFDKTLVEVAPNSTAKILMTLSVPDNADADKEMKWAMVKVKTANEAIEAEDKNKKLKLKMQPSAGVGIKVHQRPPGAAKDIKMISFEKLNDTTCRVGCNNTGKTSLECKLSIELTGVDSEFKETFSREGLHILPGTKRYIDMSIPATVPKGKYNAIAILDAGDDDVPLEASQTAFEIN